MPLSDPQLHFDTYVDPSYRDYMDDKLKRHKAACAIVAVYHFWERLYEYYEENDSPHLSGITNSGDFKKMLISKYPDLGLLRISTSQRILATSSRRCLSGGLCPAQAD